MYHRVLALDLLLALACALLLGVAIAVQRHGLREAWKDTLRSPWWIAGVVVELLGDLCYVGAASAEGARITIMQPIVVLHFLVAMGAGMALLRERFTRQEWIAASVLVAGGVLILLAAFATRPAPDVGVNTLLVLSLVTGIALSGIGLGVLVRRHRAAEVLLAVASGLTLSSAVVATRVAGMHFRAGDHRVKSFLLSSPAPWLVVGASLAGFVLMQLALRAGRAAVVSPIVALVTLIVPLPISVVVFHEPLPVSTAIGSVLVAIALVLFLARRA